MLGQLEKRIELLHSATAIIAGLSKDNVLMRQLEGVLEDELLGETGGFRKFGDLMKAPLRRRLRRQRNQ